MPGYLFDSIQGRSGGPALADKHGCSGIAHLPDGRRQLGLEAAYFLGEFVRAATRHACDEAIVDLVGLTVDQGTGRLRQRRPQRR